MKITKLVLILVQFKLIKGVEKNLFGMLNSFITEDEKEINLEENLENEIQKTRTEYNILVDEYEKKKEFYEGVIKTYTQEYKIYSTLKLKYHQIVKDNQLEKKKQQKILKDYDNQKKRQIDKKIFKIQKIISLLENFNEEKYMVRQRRRQMVFRKLIISFKHKIRRQVRYRFEYMRIMRIGGSFNMNPKFLIDYEKIQYEDYSIDLLMDSTAMIFEQITMPQQMLSFILKLVILKYSEKKQDTYLYDEGAIYAKSLQINLLMNLMKENYDFPDFLWNFFSEKQQYQIKFFFTKEKLFTVSYYLEYYVNYLKKDEFYQHSQFDEFNLKQYYMDDSMMDMYRLEMIEDDEQIMYFLEDSELDVKDLENKEKIRHDEYVKKHQKKFQKSNNKVKDLLFEAKIFNLSNMITESEKQKLFEQIKGKFKSKKKVKIKKKIQKKKKKSLKKNESFDVYDKKQVQENIKEFQDVYDKINPVKKDPFLQSIEINGVPLQKIRFQQQALETYLQMNERLLGLFLYRNLFVMYYKKGYFKEIKSRKHYEEKINDNIRQYLLKKKKSIGENGEYAFWLDSFISKIKHLGFFEEYDEDTCSNKIDQKNHKLKNQLNKL